MNCIMHLSISIVINNVTMSKISSSKKQKISSLIHLKISQFLMLSCEFWLMFPLRCEFWIWNAMFKLLLIFNLCVFTNSIFRLFDGNNICLFIHKRWKFIWIGKKMKWKVFLVKNLFQFCINDDKPYNLVLPFLKKMFTHKN